MDLIRPFQSPLKFSEKRKVFWYHHPLWALVISEACNASSGDPFSEYYERNFSSYRQQIQDFLLMSSCWKRKANWFCLNLWSACWSLPTHVALKVIPNRANVFPHFDQRIHCLDIHFMSEHPLKYYPGLYYLFQFRNFFNDEDSLAAPWCWFYRHDIGTV